MSAPHVLSLARLLAVSLGSIAALSCARHDTRSPGDTANGAVAAARGGDGALPADEEVVRSPGVPADPDDTAAARYGKHEAPRRLSNPACRPLGVALCLRDTARTIYSVSCCMPDERRTQWLVFAAARDSLQLFIEPAREAYLTMAPSNAAGVSAETALGVDAPWLRARFPAAGSYIFTAGIASDSATAYELRTVPVIATGASLPTGLTARLTLMGAKQTRIAVAPRSMLPSADSAALNRFAVKPGTYQVLLVRDTIFSACALPCLHPAIFSLTSGRSVTVAPR